MAGTKEDILMTALRLFAKDGYEAVSVSTIAGELGITKGALYKHYKNKRDIFDSIVERMYRIDAENSRENKVPEAKYEAEPKSYEDVSLEQYRSAEMAKLYADCIVSGPVEYTEDIFREMMKKGILKKADPKQLAVEFYAPMYLLINMADRSDDKAGLAEMLNSHIERFICHNSAAG